MGGTPDTVMALLMATRSLVVLCLPTRMSLLLHRVDLLRAGFNYDQTMLFCIFWIATF